MPKRNYREWPRWRVMKISGAKAQEITTVPAPDADKAIKEVIRLHQIEDQDTIRRLIARPV